MRISLATPASRPGPRAATTVALLLLLSGCDANAGAVAQPVEGLLVLTKGDAAALHVLAAKKDSDKAVSISLPLPAGDVSWISAGPGAKLVATTADGKFLTSDAVDPRGAAADLAGLEWKPVKAIGDGAAVVPTARYGTWDPGGGRFAALAGDVPGGGDVTLLLIDPGAAKFTKVPLQRPLLLAPPVWLDADRLLLVTGSTTDPAAVVVDTTTGKVAKGPAGERRLATSGNGRVIAASAGQGAPVILRSSKGWLSDDGTSIGSIDVPDGSTEAVALALDRSGDRLAIVWKGQDGALRYDVHDGTDGWRRVSSTPLAGSGDAVVAWLR